MPIESPRTADGVAAPVQAASALVVRPCVGGAEVLVVRRHPNLRFLGGYWVFPGGVTDPADAGTPNTGEKPTAYGPPPALRVAAARELFEETGLLIATLNSGPTGSPPRLLPARQRQQVSRRNNPGHFAELLHRQNAAIDMESFQPWAHWITPSLLRRRFDTWFFIVAAPTDQAVQIDGAEIADARWVQPAEWAFGERVADFPITPPTQLVLRELAHEIQACGSLDRLLAAAAGRSVLTVLPKLVTGDTAIVLLPWDPEYNEIPGEGSRWDAVAIAARRGWPSRLPAGVGKAQ